MATRTSSRSSSTRKAPAQQPPSAFELYLKRAVAYHASAITVLWVLVLFFSLGIGLVLVVLNVRIAEEREGRLALEQRVTDLGRGVVNLSVLLENMQGRPSALTPPAQTSASSTPSVPVAPTPSIAPGTNSPTGTLDRGSLSPDGKKFAGYDDVTVGKKGIGVEVTGETRVRHIVIFNPKTQSSGQGMPQAATMSVRWTDNQTIQYNLLTLKNGKWVPSVETVKIFF